ncbi:hypothetical protein FE257_005755 [Aspergillus nanangensis]|uniref:Wax synthase domain-containing protein n=1 Tax=Aspergillus nanangensis TaxID=2582783 RepID=A0AAD4GUH6_ASPNN|nr:hypothetical protein FE257_005755 [Aspergillus nanangensis]
MGAFAIIILCTWNCTVGARDYFENRALTTTISGYSTQLLFHYLDVALVRQWPFKGDKVHEKDQTLPQWGERLIFGFSLTFTCRFIGTPDQVKYIPPFSTRDPHFIPSRRQFLQKAALTIVACYIGIAFIQSYIGAVHAKHYVSVHHVLVFRRLPEIMSEEVLTRVMVCVVTLININLTQRGLYNIIGFMAVFVGISEPREWPPFYGSFFEAYTIRRVWGRFWHQSNTHKFQTLSTFVAHKVLRIPRGMLAARYVKNVLAFVISGLMHVPIDLATGLSIYESGAMSCFGAQIIGLLVEDFIIGIYHKFVAASGWRLPSLVERMLGYIWTISFFVWSTPAYVYPKIHHVKSSVIPISFQGPLLDALGKDN